MHFIGIVLTADGHATGAISCLELRPVIFAPAMRSLNSSSMQTNRQSGVNEIVSKQRTRPRRYSIYAPPKYMQHLGLSPSASYECGAASEVAHHIASECPLHSCNGDLVVLDTAAYNWLHDL